jgi:hypothetical protein
VRSFSKTSIPPRFIGLFRLSGFPGKGSSMPSKYFDPILEVYEDEIPVEATDEEYQEWYDRSFVDGVRMANSPEKKRDEVSGALQGH